MTAMTTDPTSVLARLLSDPSLRSAFARDRAGVLYSLGVVDEPQRAALLSLRPGQLEAQALVLLGKRFHAVAAMLPRTMERLGEQARERFHAHAQAFWPTGHRRHLDDAVAFGAFLARRHPGYLDVAEWNRARFDAGSCKVRVHLASVRMPDAAPRRAVQLLVRRRGGGSRCWLVYFGWS